MVTTARGMDGFMVSVMQVANKATFSPAPGRVGVCVLMIVFNSKSGQEPAEYWRGHESRKNAEQKEQNEAPLEDVAKDD